ncbi:MAG TPA: hypothetical protein VHW05_05150 [Phenylobacterium sp.]|nr:hypothetical protein [Phenylobacterium sp.]
MRKRRSAAVFAASLLVHIALFGAWFATHPAGWFVEPATMQIELIGPAPRAKPPPKPARAAPPLRLHPAKPATPPSLAPLIAPTPPAGPQGFTDEELLAGPRPSVEQLRDGPVRNSAIRDGPPPLPCKPADQRTAHDPAPPCPVFKETAEMRARREVNAYRDRYGPAGAPSANDYPSLRCVFAHTHCGPADPTMDPLHPPPR